MHNYVSSIADQEFKVHSYSTHIPLKFPAWCMISDKDLSSYFRNLSSDLAT